MSDNAEYSRYSSSNPNQVRQPLPPVEVKLRGSPEKATVRNIRHPLKSEAQTSQELGLIGGYHLMAEAKVPVYDKEVDSKTSQYISFFILQTINAPVRLDLLSASKHRDPGEELHGAMAGQVWVLDEQSYTNLQKTNNSSSQAEYQQNLARLPVNLVSIEPGRYVTIGRGRDSANFDGVLSPPAGYQPLASKQQFTVAVGRPDDGYPVMFGDHSGNGTVLKYRPDINEKETLSPYVEPQPEQSPPLQAEEIGHWIGRQLVLPAVDPQYDPRNP